VIVLFSDFGTQGPYLGQVHVVLQQQAPGVPIVNLLADAPRFSPRASAHLLAALSQRLPANSIVFAVVDPGVGSDEREPVIVRADNRWYVGPGNGLFDVVMGRATQATLWRIIWRPPSLSPTFHGRDLFAPVAARLARGEKPQNKALISELPLLERRITDRIGDKHRSKGILSERWDAAKVVSDPGDLEEIIYIDWYGNAMTGIRAPKSERQPYLRLPNGSLLSSARTFHEVEPGAAFWYGNSLGLIEVAVNQGHAATALGLDIGASVAWE
jgi:S-adenosyl-L-methionine hydrolase (adenosine-forming)